MKITSKILIGAILIFLGLVFFLETAGILAYISISAWNLIWLLWPILLIGLGIKMVFDRNITAGIIFLSFGLIFLLTQLFHWSFFSILWPVVLIAVGLSIIFKNENTHINSGKTYDDSDKLAETLIFWGIDKNMDSKKFKGGEVNAVFGGGKIDLRNVEIDKDGAKLTLNAAFGGIEVIVPQNCKIITDGMGILGGWENHTKTRTIEKPILEITGAAIFGGVDIKE